MSRGRVRGGFQGRGLACKHRILHRFLVPLNYGLRGNETMHIELTPAGG